MKSKTDPRHTSRKLALSYIFSWLFNEPSDDTCFYLSQEIFEEENSDYDVKMSQSIVDGVKKNLEEIDNIITTSAPEWPLDKIAKIDLVILRIAIFEIIFEKKVPAKVVIDEAVELSKEFGNDTTHKFVNGVLGTIIDKYGK